MKHSTSSSSLIASWWIIFGKGCHGCESWMGNNNNNTTTTTTTTTATTTTRRSNQQLKQTMLMFMFMNFMWYYVSCVLCVLFWVICFLRRDYWIVDALSRRPPWSVVSLDATPTLDALEGVWHLQGRPKVKLAKGNRSILKLQHKIQRVRPTTTPNFSRWWFQTFGDHSPLQYLHR